MQTSCLNKEEENMINLLNSIGQGHLVTNITDFSQEERQAFVEQCTQINNSYPGGLKAYTERAKKLLKESNENVNPFEGFTPKVPQGESINFEDIEQINRLESIGQKQIDHACFVLVAGGLGERLGYKGIKVEIPIELLTNQCFLQYYISYILALQARGSEGLKIPLAIMTSDDTYSLTVKLLQDNQYFGMQESQITIMKQEKVPALMNNEAHFAQQSGKLTLETKPHGHGDAHCLIYSHKLHEQWLSQGKKWIFFFQDTNPLVFRSLLTVLGVSAERNLEVNSVTVPRKPNEAVGAICQLVHQDGRNLTINVEYNQLDSLLQSTIGKEETDANGNSVFPGNINSLLFSLPEYTQILNDSQGVIAEFINPKYTDSTKTTFKSPTRLECMMQDYPKLLKNADRVGFTQIDRGYAFAAVKNDLVSAAQKYTQGLSPECAGSCEEAFYKLNANILRLAGANVEQGESQVKNTFEGITYDFDYKIALEPSFGVTVAEINKNLNGKKLNISKNSSLIIKGNFQLQEDIDVKGHVVIDNGKVQKSDKALQFQAIDLQNEQQEYLKIRGFKLA